MITIPQNKIIKSKGYENFGDIYQSFSLDLTSNLGMIRANRMVEGTTNGVQINDYPIAFVFYNNKYMLLQEDFVLYGGSQPSDIFDDNEGEPDSGQYKTEYSDMTIFNGYVYISGSSKLYKSDSNGGGFTEVGSGFTALTPHLMTVFKNRLYITDNYVNIISLDTSDIQSSTTYTINLPLDNEWVITSIKSASELIYIGCLNTITGAGRVYTWDGSLDIASNKYELQAGVISSCVLDNVHYIVDAHGVLKRYAGNSYVEVAKIPKQNPNFFKGVDKKTNARFIHPNGMQTTDEGNILILIDNSIEAIGNDDSVQAGIWEYSQDIGLYHKFAISTIDDFGQTRLYNAGALYTRKTSSPSISGGGFIICGADILTSSNKTTHNSGVFYDDSLDTYTKYGIFVSTILSGDIEREWQNIYTIFKKLLNTDSKIIVKYRTEKDNPTEVIITWTDIDRFTTTTDISEYNEGDEIYILQGRGSGKCSHIKSIINNLGTYTVILDENYPVGVIGYTAIASISHWIKAGQITYTDEKQWKELTLPKKRTSPFIQLKVCLNFYGKDELNKLQIISKKTIDK